MTLEHPPEGPERARFVARNLADAGWADVQARMRARLAHDVNGRAAALLAVVELVREVGPDAATLALLDGEVDKLTQVARALRSVPWDSGMEEAEPVIPAELLTEALATAGLERGLEYLDRALEPVGSDVEPVLVSRGRTLAVLAVVLSRAGWASDEAEAPLRVTLRQEEDRVTVEMPRGGAHMTADETAALRRILELDHGGIETAGEGIRVHLQTLRAGRARQSAG